MADRDLLQRLLETLGEPLCFIDADETVACWNQSAEALTGYRQDEVVGRVWWSVLQPQEEDGSPLRAWRHRARDPEGLVLWQEMWVQTRSRGRRLLKVRSAPHGDRGAIKTFYDLTAATEEARTRDEFVATLVHDLKSPLDSLMGFSTLLGDPELGEIAPQKLEYLRLMKCTGTLMYDLITNISTTFRLNRGGMPYDMRDFALEGLFEHLRETFYPQATLASVQLEIPPTDLHVHCDLRWIRQVFHNLISNAFRYTGMGGAVRVSAAAEGDRVRVRVRDTGRGIPREEHAQLFQQYVQRSGEVSGAGLGLYIVKRVLEAHGSGVALDSEPGRGTEFSFCLTSATPRAAAPLRILAAGLPEALTLEESHEVQSVQSGLEALEVVSGFQPDVILVHSTLPDLDPVDFHSELTQLPAWHRVPVVLLAPRPHPVPDGRFAAILAWPADHRVLTDTLRRLAN